MSDIKQQASKKMSGAISHLSEDLKSLRTGRASPALVESVMIEVYGTQMPLKDLASISTPEPRQLVITPFDANNVGGIAKSIEKANMNLQPIAEANLVRITIPPMNENLRKDMVKECKKMCEHGKVSIRNARRECNEIIKQQKGDGDISEDIAKKLEKTVQDLTNDFCKEADAISSTKEKEIMTI